VGKCGAEQLVVGLVDVVLGHRRASEKSAQHQFGRATGEALQKWLSPALAPATPFLFAEAQKTFS